MHKAHAMSPRRRKRKRGPLYADAFIIRPAGGSVRVRVGCPKCFRFFYTDMATLSTGVVRHRDHTITFDLVYEGYRRAPFAEWRKSVEAPDPTAPSRYLESPVFTDQVRNGRKC